jgi:ketosteroid isomerase-like protein
VQGIIALLCVVVTCFFLQACNRDTKETQSEDKIEKEIHVDLNETKVTEDIMFQEKKWAEALVDEDLNFVASIMHDDFRLIRAYGNAPSISKEMYPGMKGMSVSSAEVTSLNVCTEMDSIVVARTTWTLDWEQEGIGKLPPHFDVIDIWKMNQDGIWQVLSRVSQTVDKPYFDKKNNEYE